jgi:hypothetical protein
VAAVAVCQQRGRRSRRAGSQGRLLRVVQQGRTALEDHPRCKEWPVEEPCQRSAWSCHQQDECRHEHHRRGPRGGGSRPRGSRGRRRAQRQQAAGRPPGRPNRPSPATSQPASHCRSPFTLLASAVGLLVLWPYWLDLSHCAKSAPPYPPPLRSLVLWLWKAVTLCCQQGGRAHPHHA